MSDSPDNPWEKYGTKDRLHALEGRATLTFWLYVFFLFLLISYGSGKRSGSHEAGIVMVIALAFVASFYFRGKSKEYFQLSNQKMRDGVAFQLGVWVLSMAGCIAILFNL